MLKTLMHTQVLINAILLMGGRGARFKSSLPKQFHTLAGKKIYIHTLESFLACELFAQIILVCPMEWSEEVEKELKTLLPELSRDKIRIVAGGETRQDSSYLGLLACPKETSHVVIHDAVRPFVSEEILQENIRIAKLHGAADTCIPSADTIVHSGNSETIDTIPPRHEYLRGQTPQSFSYPLILKAHEEARTKNLTATDDCALVLALGHPIHVAKGEESNIKITTDLDLYLAEQLFRRTRPKPNLHAESRSIQGKCYAITGGTGDIGQAIAKLLRLEGATPLLLSRSAPEYAADLTSPEQTQKIFAKLAQEHGPIDGLINCVGLFKLKAVEELTTQEIEELIAANLTSVIFACKFAEIKEGGDMINIASSAYSRGRKTYAIYSAAKAAVVNFTQALAEERPELNVNTLIPQRTHSRMRSAYFPEEDLNKLLTPSQVAEAALNLLKERPVTGMAIEVRLHAAEVDKKKGAKRAPEKINC